MTSLYITWLYCWALRLLFLTSITCPAHLFACSFIQSLPQLSCSPLFRFSLARLSILTQQGEVKAESGRTETNLKEVAAGLRALWADICASDWRRTIHFCLLLQHDVLAKIYFFPLSLPLGMQTCPHLCTLIKNNKATFPDSLG